MHDHRCQMALSRHACLSLRVSSTLFRWIVLHHCDVSHTMMSAKSARELGHVIIHLFDVGAGALHDNVLQGPAIVGDLWQRTGHMGSKMWSSVVSGRDDG
jgi:hypothetical protein